MSVLQEYEQIRKEFGEEKWEQINKYLECNENLLLSDVLYKENQYKEFQKWNTKDITDRVFDKIEKLLVLENRDDVSIDYVLINEKYSSKSFAILSNEEDIIKIDLTNEKVIDLASWDYNIDGYFLEDLNEHQIGYTSEHFNYNAWSSIHEWYPKDLDEKVSLQKYLHYCEKNGITKDYIDNHTSLDVPDIMMYKMDEPIYYQNNKVLLMTGVRNEDTKVALVMIDGKDKVKDEYIIAFDYETKDDTISWGYGKYYGDNFDNAKIDIEKAVAGESLADSFSSKSKTNETKERSEYGI